MIFDTFTIVCSLVALFILFLAWLFNPFRRRFFNAEANEGATDNPPVSLVIITQGNAQALEENLPLWLTQRYNADLQIIVVTDEGDHYADDVLKRIATTHDIHRTFVPQTSRYMSRTKLAVTLGVKAARHQMVMLVNADCSPASDLTLTLLVQANNPSSCTMVMPVSHYQEPCKGFYQFEHLHRSLYYMHSAVSGAAYGSNSNSLLFCKDMFMQGQGFLGSLHLIGGEYEILTNRYATREETSVFVNPKAQLIQQTPSRHIWRNRAVAAWEIRRHLKHGFITRLTYITDQIVLHLSYIALIGFAVASGITQHWISLGVAAFLFLCLLFTRIIQARKVIRQLDIKINTFLIPIYELRIIWHNAMTALLHKFTDKIEFTCHKL